ncbi:DUF6049 family protein [Salinibacterium sp. SYSU T00001]|uniref:DUF6049 family protein n=1 Tax=Homoserinimonas sedimenticola TaxID=2986805 RepID=UPI00223698E2|nr:DUF6049 family protein [Salinibacterium sedimenticola]MCW4385795.1 DUF6049 family protein [Salinibacterium sedimenticola]
MPLTHLVSRWSAALLGAALVLSGSVASSATPDAAGESTPDAAVAASNGAPTTLVLAAPIVAPEGETALIPADDLETFTSSSGVLTRQLNAVIDRPIALGVDPRILASIRILGTSAPESALDWLERLENASNETFSLAYADADVAALSQAGMESIPLPTDFQVDPNLFPAPQAPEETVEPTEDADEQAEPSASPSASPETSPTPSPSPGAPSVPTGDQLVDLPFTLGPIVWPREDTVVAGDLATFAADEQTVTILDSSNVNYGRDAIPASATAGGARVLVSNNDISALLREAVSATTDASWTAAMTQLTAALAGWGGGSSPLLATLGRDIPLPANRVSQTLTALATTPGVVLGSIESTLDEPPVEVSVVDSPVEPERLATLQSALQTEPATTAFASVLDNPSLITGDQRRRMLALASNAWIDSPQEWQEAVAAFVVRSGELLNAVHVLESSTINLLSDTGNVPVTISNSLPYPVTVVVHMWANRAVLDVLEDSVTVTIEAQSQARAAVPVQSIANGTAVLVVSLTSPTQVPIGAPMYVTTNVQAGWETAFTTTVAGVVLLVFVIGIARTVARRRRERRERNEVVAS